eukprot:Hpha_TRINITY_DN15175_c1_g6::TRINITY_DN15175_c1_g6_i1::g.127620::m.127620
MVAEIDRVEVLLGSVSVKVDDSEGSDIVADSEMDSLGDSVSEGSETDSVIVSEGISRLSVSDIDIVLVNDSDGMENVKDALSDGREKVSVCDSVVVSLSVTVGRDSVSVRDAVALGSEMVTDSESLTVGMVTVVLSVADGIVKVLDMEGRLKVKLPVLVGREKLELRLGIVMVEEALGTVRVNDPEDDMVGKELDRVCDSVKSSVRVGRVSEAVGVKVIEGTVIVVDGEPVFVREGVRVPTTTCPSAPLIHPIANAAARAQPK